MKSVNAVAKLSNRVSILSFLGLMILGLAVGRPTFAVEDFKLWQKLRVNENATLLKHLSKTESAKSVKWLVNEPDFKKFSTSFSTEPFQFVEGVKAAMLKSITDGKAADFKKAAKEGFDKLDAADFGGFMRQNAFKDLLGKVLGMERSDLEDASFLEELFSDPQIRAALGLTERNPDAQPIPSPVASPVPSPVASPNPGKDDTKTDTKVDAETAKRLAEEQARNAQLQQQIQAMLAAQQQGKGAGEVNDKALENAAQQICDRFNALQTAQQQNQDLLQQQLNGVNELFNRFAAASRTVDNGNNNKDRLEDALIPALQNALGNQQQQTPPAAPPQPPTIPPTQATNDRNDNGLFDQPLPKRQDPQPEEPLPPLTFPTQPSNALNQPINLELPTSSGARELRDVQDALSKVQNRTSVASTLAPNASLTDLVMAKARVQSEKREVQAALIPAKDRLARLEEALEEAKGGGRDLLPAWVKKQEAQLQANVDKAKKQVEGLQQQAQFAGNDQNARNALTAQFQQFSAQQSQAEEALNKFKAEVETKVQEGNKAVKTLAKRRDQLQSEIGKLESAMGSITEEETAMQQLINNQMQAQLAAIQGAGQPGGTPNVNRIANGVPGRTAPRSTVPGRLGVGGGANLQSGGNVPTGSGMRGPLGGK